MFKLVRKFSLFMILFIVALSSYLKGQNSTDWQEPLWVQMYPINGDGSEITSDYITKLEKKDFISIEEFMQEEAAWYDMDIKLPVKVILGKEIHELPPALPEDPGPLSIGIWSLKLRWWASNMTSNQPGPSPDIRMFLIYFDPAEQPVLAHSLGLKQGLIGVVNVFAKQSQAQTNNFVITHEMLHTLGATDKYDSAGNMPAYPDGYGDPELYPLYPQTKAEVMGGRIALSERNAVIPEGLHQAVIGPATADEIRWKE
ncbi:MAG: hypothetical protein GY727_09265 [Gammaproteobacteria bacterium]|nr:hypothetical protein [Gammaproteobacteria bacterium]MCP4089519.1 hypothetical protein [Gammaproteobacteria bacterium]MCP4276225.1 hypothetical protein [Gammaproteobacteria bacterium]MCP4832922.1 hypothetical protein [Gammaproteobacteria bacterium]